MAGLRKLVSMTDTEVQAWLRKVEKAGVEKLAAALMMSGNDVREKVYKNMSPKAVEAMKEKVEKCDRSSEETEKWLKDLENILD